MTEHRALFVGNFLSRTGGHRQYCEDLADRIESRGWSVARTSREHVRLKRLADMVRVTWSRRGEYDVAHVDLYSGAAFLWAEVVCFELRRLGKPVVLTLHGGSLPDFVRRWPRRTRRLLRSATVVTAPSTYLRDAMTEVGSGIVVVPNAIEISRYPFRARTTCSRLIWLRAFHSIYNPVLAVEVLARLAPSVTLDMIGKDTGDGSLEAVRQRARELGVEARLRIVPGVSKADVPARLAVGDIFLNTTDVDNTPVSVLEAMACGLCIVSTSVGGIPHLLRGGTDALLVPPRDPVAMTTAVERLIADPTLASRLSSTARENALAFDWQRVLDQWEILLKGASQRA